MTEIIPLRQNCKPMKKSANFETDKVVTISIAHFIHDTYSSFLAPVLPLLITKLGISYSLSSLLSIAQRLPSLLNPFIGLLADKISLRYLVIISPLVTAVAMSLLGVAPSYIVLVILLFIMGISSSLFHVPSPVIIKKIAGERTGMGMSFYMVGGELARTLGPITILGAVSLWGFEGTWKLIPFALIASVMVWLKLRKITVSDEFKKRTVTPGKKINISNYLPFFICLAGFQLFAASIKSALTFYIPTYLNEMGESLWMGGIALSVFQLAGAAGSFISGTISDKIGRKRMLLVAAIANPILMWLFVQSGNSWYTIPILGIMGMFIFASTPVMLAIVTTMNTTRPAFFNGIYMTLMFLISSLVIMLIGIAADKFGLTGTYHIAAFTGLGAIPFIVFLPTKFRY